MSVLTVEAMECFRTHHGLSTAPMLTRAGVSRRQRERAVAEGILEVLYERVYRIISAPVTLQSRCAALCLAYQRGFITGPTAGHLLDLRRMPPALPVRFGHPHGAHIGPFDDVRLRQSTKIPASHVVTRGDGIRLASAARLAFDLTVHLDDGDLRSVTEQMLQRGMVTMATLGQMAAALARPGRPGSERFVAMLLGRSGPPAESHVELRLAEALRRRGVPVVAQYGGVPLPNGRRIRVDLAVPAVRWGVELDLHPDHLMLTGTAKDKRRDRWCHMVGWQIERVSELDLLDFEGLCDELTDLYRRRCLLVA